MTNLGECYYGQITAVALAWILQVQSHIETLALAGVFFTPRDIWSVFVHEEMFGISSFWFNHREPLDDHRVSRMSVSKVIVEKGLVPWVED